MRNGDEAAVCGARMRMVQHDVEDAGVLERRPARRPADRIGETEAVLLVRLSAVAGFLLCGCAAPEHVPTKEPRTPVADSRDGSGDATEAKMNLARCRRLNVEAETASEARVLEISDESRRLLPANRRAGHAAVGRSLEEARRLVPELRLESADSNGDETWIATPCSIAPPETLFLYVREGQVTRFETDD